MQALDIMKTELVTVLDTDPIFKAVRAMVDFGVTGLPVVNGWGDLVGIISEKDVLTLLYDFADLAHRVSDFMSTEVISFEKDTELEEVAKCFIQNKFRRVPILDDGKLIGIISRKDVINWIQRNRKHNLM